MFTAINKYNRLENQQAFYAIVSFSELSHYQPHTHSEREGICNDENECSAPQPVRRDYLITELNQISLQKSYQIFSNAVQELPVPTTN